MGVVILGVMLIVVAWVVGTYPEVDNNNNNSCSNAGKWTVQVVML